MKMTVYVQSPLILCISHIPYRNCKILAAAFSPLQDMFIVFIFALFTGMQSGLQVFFRDTDTAMLLHFEWAISAYGRSALLASLSISSSPKPTARLDVYQTQQIKGGKEICVKKEMDLNSSECSTH